MNSSVGTGNALSQSPRHVSNNNINNKLVNVWEVRCISRNCYTISVSKIIVQADDRLTAEEVAQLRIKSGWEADVEEWRLCLQQNLLNVSARNEEGELLGVGFISGTIRHAEVTDLVVLPEFREHGIGSRIMKALCEYAATHHIRYFGLTYDTKTPWLKDFYEEYGFRPIDFAMWHESSLKKKLPQE